MPEKSKEELLESKLKAFSETFDAFYEILLIDILERLKPQLENNNKFCKFASEELKASKEKLDKIREVLEKV